MMGKKQCKECEALEWASELLRNIYRGRVYEVKMLIDVANACKEALENQLQPLTDEEMWKVLDAQKTWSMSDVFRAAEKAHGIGE